MKKYADAFVERNQLNEAETAVVREMLAAHEAELLDYLTDEVKKKRELKEQFAEYLHKLDRLADQKQAATHNIPYEQKRNWDEQQKLRGQPRLVERRSTGSGSSSRPTWWPPSATVRYAACRPIPCSLNLSTVW